MNNQVQSLCVNQSDSILSALKRMDEISRKLLIVINEEKYVRLISIGDIQRAIIKGISLDLPVKTILRDETKVASVHDDIASIKNEMRERRNEFMPIIDDEDVIVDVIFWDDLFKEEIKKTNEHLGLPVVIMAGGKGTRLRPLTNILPKPLIPLGEKTMMEDIMDRFVGYGCNQFFVSVNYKADVIKRYFENLPTPDYNITYFQEDKPLGTAGSLHLLKGEIKNTFFVSNCDIIIDDDYSEILKYHRNNCNEITIVGAIRTISIPYGTLVTKEGGLLESLKEKPNLTYLINTGMYILEPSLIEEIPEGEFYHITYLIDKLCKEGRRVGVYPINEGAWIDVGNWDEYLHQFAKKD